MYQKIRNIQSLENYNNMKDIKERISNRLNQRKQTKLNYKSQVSSLHWRQIFKFQLSVILVYVFLIPLNTNAGSHSTKGHFYHVIEE